MKFKKILSSVIAAAMTVTTFSAFSTTATAETLNYTGTWDEYNTINYSFDITALADTDAINVTVYDSTVEDAEAYPFILFQLSDSNTNWGNNCYIEKAITDDITEGDAETITVTVGALKAKYEEVVGSAWTSSTKLRFAFWNGGTANTTIEIDTDYVAPATDAWVDNGDGSYTFTKGSEAGGGTDLALPLGGALSQTLAVSFDVTVEGGASGTVGANVNGAWTKANGDEAAWTNTSSVQWFFNGKLNTVPMFQIWWANAGSKITISNINFVYSHTAYLQETTDGTAVRGVMYIEESLVNDVKTVDFTFSNGTDEVTVSSTKYYKTVSVAGEPITAPEGYVFVAYAVTGIPADADVICTKIKLNL